MEIRVYQEGDWFSLTDCNKDELPAVHTDQEPHFIVIGTIYFMSQWLYFFVPPTPFFPLISVATPQNVTISAACDATVTPDVRRWWLQSACGEASQLSTDVASDFSFWHQSGAVVSDVNLTDARCLPYFNLLLPACQNDNVICSPVFLHLPTVYVPRFLFVNPAPIIYVLTHISVGVRRCAAEQHQVTR